MSEKDKGINCDTSGVSDTDISHTLPKRTRRHINERDKSNTLTRKQKLHKKATPGTTNGQSRYIKPTDKTLERDLDKTQAIDKLSNSLQSQPDACMGIKVEPQEEATEKRSEQFEMIEIQFKHEQTDEFESKLKIYNTEEIPVSQGFETPVQPKQIGMWQPRLAVSHDQIMVLLAELQENPEAARGFSRMAEGRQRNKRFWTQLARTLNAVRGGAHKNADGWAKYWQDKKRNVKASVARREAACPVSGGDDDQEVRTPLTDVEQRVVAIMGGLAFASGDAQRIPVFCGEGPRNSAAAATQCTSADNIMEIPVTPAPATLEETNFAQTEPLPQASPPLQPWSSPLPSPTSAQSAQPPSQSRNLLKSTVCETRAVEDENLALLRSQHEEKMVVERERNLLLRQLVDRVDKAVGMLGEVLSRIPS